MTFRAMILRAAGTNCDGETEAALVAAGAAVDRVHVNRLAESPSILGRYHLLVFAGGFTFGDDVGSGAVFAYTLRERLLPQLEGFVASGRRVLGVCNGFQVLVRLGLLPGDGGRASLLPNASGRFEDRWVRLRAGQSPGPWFEPGAEYLIPVAHAEGRFAYFSRDGHPQDFPEARIAVSYLGAAKPAEYPDNPNGSRQGIAGITNREGNVLGLMPHPERFVRPEHHPFWMRYRRQDGSPPTEAELPVPLGLDLYRRAVTTPL
ncbi:MAG: phosphoribosylformylglycinamidine synthase subunit PurQ [Planctomycetota bacterium]